MAIELSRPDVDGLDDVVRALRDWQRDDAPIQLHPGDLGWYQRFGTESAAAAARTWRHDGRIVAAGFLDGPEVLRMTVAPGAWRDDELARRVVDDLSATRRDVIPAGTVSLEVPDGTRLRELLSQGGWQPGEPWTPLRLDLTDPVDQRLLRVEVVRSDAQIAAFTAVHRSAWGSERFTDAVWRTMAAGPAFTDAGCLLGRDDEGVAVATVTVWSAGPGRPGLLEPLGVHAEHRGRGYGAAICRAAAAELRQRGASSVLVCTPSSLGSAVRTYAAAGFTRRPERLDLTRAA